MPNFQPTMSLRKTRQAMLQTQQVAAATIDQVNAQGKVLAQTVGRVNAMTTFLRGGFWSRLRWVLFGLPKGGE